MQVLRRAGEIFTEQVVVPAQSAPEGEARLRELFARWLAWAESKAVPGGCPFMSAANEYDDRPGPVRDYLVEGQQRWLGGLAKAARLAVDRGEFRADLDLEQFAHDFYALLGLQPLPPTAARSTSRGAGPRRLREPARRGAHAPRDFLNDALPRHRFAP